MASSKEVKKLEGSFLKEKSKFLEKIKAIKENKTNELGRAKLQLGELRNKYAAAQIHMDHIFKALSKFNIEMDTLLKSNLESKKRINDLKRLRANIPEQIKNLETQIKSNLKILRSGRRDAKKISSKKTKFTNIVKDLSHLIQKYENVIIQLTNSIKDLAKKEKNLIEGKVIWAEKSVRKDFKYFLKKYVFPAKTKVAKKSTKNKGTKKKTLAKKSPSKKAHSKKKKVLNNTTKKKTSKKQTKKKR